MVSGGVASNMYIREALAHVASKLGWRCVFPPPELCRDNGVMVAWNGLEKWRDGRGIVPWHEVMDVPVVTRSPLGRSLMEEVEKAHLKCRFVKLPGQENVGNNYWFDVVSHRKLNKNDASRGRKLNETRGK